LHMLHMHHKIGRMAVYPPQPFTQKLKEVAATLGITCGSKLPGPTDKRTSKKYWGGWVGQDHYIVAGNLYDGLHTLAENWPRNESALKALASKGDFQKLAKEQFDSDSRPRLGACGSEPELAKTKAPQTLVSNKTCSDRAPTALSKRLAEKWNTRLLPCLIDSSYLQSAGRALVGAAKSNTDIENFLRFLGEVVSQRDVAIVLATNGPVFKHSMEVVSQVNKIGGRNVVRIIPGDSVCYSKVAANAIPRIRANLNRWICGPRSEAQSVDIAPKGGEVDLDIHQFLASGARGAKNWPLGNGGAKFLAHHILTHANVVSELRDAISVRELPWLENNTVSLCAAIRTECYFELASSQGLSYQPSLARYAIASRSATSHPILSIVGNRKLRAGKLTVDLAGNERFLNALVTLGDFSPHAILGVAAELSDEISQLRDHLTEPSPREKGDAWVVWQDQRVDQIRKLYLRMTREHQGVGLEVVLGASDGTYILGRPLEAAELDKLKEIITPLAAPVIVAAEHTDVTSTEKWRQFVWNCGIRT